MTRRHALVLVATLVAVLLPASAQAAGTGQLTSPSPDQQLTGLVQLQAEVEGDNRDMFGNGPDHVVKVRLADASGGGAAPGTAAVDLSCVSGPCNADSTWGGVTFDTVGFQPFGRPDRVCNGAWYLQVAVDGAAFSPGQRVLVSQLPGAPTGVTVAGDVRRATVTWVANPEQDLAGYRVQRRPEGSGAWTSVAEVDAGTTRFEHTTDPGTYEYRVLALRPDGRGADGAPAPICTDTGRELAAASSPRAVTVDAPAPTPTPSPTTGGSGGGSGGGGTGGGGSGSGGGSGDGSSSGGGSSSDGGSTDGGDSDGDGTTPDGDDGTTPGDGTTPDGAADGGDGTTPDGGTDDDGGDGTTPDEAGDGTTPDRTTPRPSAGGRIAPPAAGGRSSTLSLGSGVVGLDDPTAPRVAGPGRQQPRERFFGEGEGFSEEIDFGDVEAIAGSELRERTVLAERTVRVPGALQSILGQELAVGRILTSIAGGLVLLALALHLRRWTREGAEV